MDKILIIIYDWLVEKWRHTEVEELMCPLAAALGLLFGVIIPGNELLPDSYRMCSSIMGWTYFFMWAISFYPQAVTNYKNGSSIGLKSDKLAYDLIGFECMVIYESSMYFSSYTRKLYRDDHDGNSPEVEVNDVWFAIHSLILTFVVIGQMVHYDGWKQWPTKVAVAICSTLISLQLFGLGVLVVYGRDIHAISYLAWLYLLSAIKVLITFLKFLPQVLHNYERKSTRGWSMPGTIMDLIGSVLSIAQLLLDCYFMKDWKGVEGNFIKLGLGVISGTYDVIFIIQHYILYRSNIDDEKIWQHEMGSSSQGLLRYKEDEDSDDSDEEISLYPLHGDEKSSKAIFNPSIDMEVTWIVN